MKHVIDGERFYIVRTPGEPDFPVSSLHRVPRSGGVYALYASLQDETRNATALPFLPRRPGAKHRALIHQYDKEGFTIHMDKNGDIVKVCRFGSEVHCYE